jgi:hypothetical protein
MVARRRPEHQADGLVRRVRPDLPEGDVEPPNRESEEADKRSADLGDRLPQRLCEQNGADIGLIKLADRNEQIWFNAAGADKLDDRTRPRIDLEANQRVP